MAVAEALEMDVIIGELRTISYDIMNNPSIVDADLMERVEAQFGQAVENLWQMHPSEAPDGFVRTLRGMPVKMDEWFRNYLIQNEKQIPPMSFFGTKSWVCAPEI